MWVNIPPTFSLVDFFMVNVGKYTVHPMDLLGIDIKMYTQVVLL